MYSAKSDRPRYAGRAHRIARTPADCHPARPRYAGRAEPIFQRLTCDVYSYRAEPDCNGVYEAEPSPGHAYVLPDRLQSIPREEPALAGPRER